MNKSLYNKLLDRNSFNNKLLYIIEKLKSEFENATWKAYCLKNRKEYYESISDEIAVLIMYKQCVKYDIDELYYQMLYPLASWFENNQYKFKR